MQSTDREVLELAKHGVLLQVIRKKHGISKEDVPSTMEEQLKKLTLSSCNPKDEIGTDLR